MKQLLFRQHHDWSSGISQPAADLTSVTLFLRFPLVMSDSHLRPDSAQKPTQDPNLRGYFVDDEFTREASVAGMPPIEATSASSSPSNSRRKQTSPHKVPLAEGVSPSEVITQRGSAPTDDPASAASASVSALRDAIKTESDSEDGNLNGDSSPSKTPTKKKKAAAAAHTTSKSDSPRKSPSVKKSKSGAENNSSVSDSSEPPSANPTSSKKRKTSASGGGEVKVEKDQVENELEAMFAGMDEESKSPTRPGSSKPATPQSTPACPVSIPKMELSDLSPDLVALSKKRGRPSKEEQQRRLEAGILSKRQKVLLRKGESLENIFARAFSNTTGKKVSEEVQPPQLKKKKKKKPQAAQGSQENGARPSKAPASGLNGDSAFPGPYVRVVSGADGALKSSSVVNGPQIVPRNMSVVDEASHRILVDALGRPSSANDPAYDSKRPDETWLCVFCHRGSHARQMGDLFGPYFVSASSLPKGHFALASPSALPQADSALEAATAAAAKFVVDAQVKKKKKRRSPSVAGGGAPTAVAPPAAGQDKPVEVWFHEDCVCWMPDIRLLGSKLYGLEEAIAGASGAVCAVCSKTGATVACVGGRSPGCRQMAHFPCAVEAGWKIVEEEFQAYCKGCKKHYA